MEKIKMSSFYGVAKLIAGGCNLFSTDVEKHPDYPAYTPVAFFTISKKPMKLKPFTWEDEHASQLMLHETLRELSPKALSFKFIDENFELQAPFAGESDSPYCI